MRALIGSTGFIGSTILKRIEVDVAVHRPDLDAIAGQVFDEVVCAGLPAEKWRANQEPETDWSNVCRLADVLSSVHAERFVLVSTVDVYQPPIGVDESDPPQFANPQAYGRNRAWFEYFCRARFPACTIVRLPGMFGDGLRKNVIFDLLEGREEQWAKVAAGSSFQFFDAGRVWDVVQSARAEGLELLNVATEPVSAGAIASLFGVTLLADLPEVRYDMRTAHASVLGGRDGYLVGADRMLADVAALRDRWSVR